MACSKHALIALPIIFLGCLKQPLNLDGTLSPIYLFLFLFSLLSEVDWKRFCCEL